MLNLLVITVFLPLLGAVSLVFFSKGDPVATRRIALGTVLATLACAAKLVLDFPTQPAEFEYSWFIGAGLDIRFSLGLDGLNLWMFALSALLSLTALLVSWKAIRDRETTFYALLLLLESGMLGVFVARDILLFYIFFEFTLIPLFFLIGIWGSEERRYAAIKFFLFTLAGSVFTFLGLLAIALWNHRYGAAGGEGPLNFSIPEITASLAQQPMDATWQFWIFLALFAGFAIKVPLFPLHTWLPLAHVQAPTAGSVLLAGILLKIGTYGFVRFCLAMLPQASAVWAPWILWLSVAGILYGALVALAQQDIKRLIAYSSVSHLGFCMLGLFALNRLGTQGGVLQMINHGLSTGGLFALVGMLYERYHTRKIEDYAGMARRLPVLSLCMLLFVFSSIGLPGMNGFAGEYLILLGMFQRGVAGASSEWITQGAVIAVLAVLGVVLGAWYMLWLVERVFFGRLREPAHAHGDEHGEEIQDLSFRELAALVPLLVFIFWIGLAPGTFLRPMKPSLDEIVSRVESAWDVQQQMADEPTLTAGKKIGRN